MQVPAELRDVVSKVDDSFSALNQLISELPSKAKQIEVWQYYTMLGRNKYKALRAEELEAGPEPVEIPQTQTLNCAKVTQSVSDAVAKKRKLDYDPEWWRGYTKLTVGQMRHILKDNRNLLAPEQRRGLDSDRKDALHNKICGLRVILKQRAVLSFDD